MADYVNFSKDAAKKVAQATKIVLASPANSPFNRGVRGAINYQPLWVKITSGSLDSNKIGTYNGDIYGSPFCTTALLTGVNVKNCIEIGNTSTLASGFTIVTTGSGCGRITNIEKIPNGTWLPLISCVDDSGAGDGSGSYWYMVQYQNQPVISSS